MTCTGGLTYKRKISLKLQCNSSMFCLDLIWSRMCNGHPGLYSMDKLTTSTIQLNSDILNTNKLKLKV